MTFRSPRNTSPDATPCSIETICKPTILWYILSFKRILRHPSEGCPHSMTSCRAGEMVCEPLQRSMQPLFRTLTGHWILRFFSKFVGEKDSRVQGVKDSRVCFSTVLFVFFAFVPRFHIWLLFRTHSSQVSRIFHRIPSRCNNMAFPLNPWTLDPLNPLG